MGSLVILGALSDLTDTLISDWIGPAFLFIVVVSAVMLWRDRKWGKLAALVGFAAIIGVILWQADILFGDGTGFNKIGSDLTQDVVGVVSPISSIEGF